MDRRALIGIAAGGVLALTAGGFFIVRAADEPDGTFDLSKDRPIATGSPTPSSSMPPLVDWPSLTSGTPVPSAPPSAVPSATPSAAPSVAPAPSATPQPPRPTSTGTAAAAPPRPKDLPTGCRSLPEACAFPNSSYAVTSGVSTVRCDMTGPDSVKISWTSAHLAASGNTPAVTDFVVRLWQYPAGDDDATIKDPARLFQVRVDAKNKHVYVSRLARGAHYACFVQELNA
ncbi:MAG TPA: hypothetical protein VNA20_00735, partial [Frankiaceae bacterium]|nr:hypothetical protein [Frankiaceae bacterium]